jgi:hypothetical protein
MPSVGQTGRRRHAVVTFFYEDVLGGLRDGDVRFVLVGGTAVILHGVLRTTSPRSRQTW